MVLVFLFGERSGDEDIQSWVGNNGGAAWLFFFLSLVLGVYGVMYGIWSSRGMGDGGWGEFLSWALPLSTRLVSM